MNLELRGETNNINYLARNLNGYILKTVIEQTEKIIEKQFLDEVSLEFADNHRHELRKLLLEKFLMELYEIYIENYQNFKLVFYTDIPPHTPFLSDKNYFNYDNIKDRSETFISITSTIMPIELSAIDLFSSICYIDLYNKNRINVRILNVHMFPNLCECSKDKKEETLNLIKDMSFDKDTKIIKEELIYYFHVDPQKNVFVAEFEDGKLKQF